MADLYGHAFSDNYRLASSKRMLALDDDTYSIIRIPRFAFIKEIWVEVLVLDADATMTVGFIGNKETAAADAFMYDAACAPGTLGMKSCKGGSAAEASGKYFRDGSGAITVTVVDADLLAFQIFVDYSVIH